MELFKLDPSQVTSYEEQGFHLRAPIQQVVFSILFGPEDQPSLELTWSQLRGCVQFILEPITGRRERVRNSTF